jgi:hypothetical protein
MVADSMPDIIDCEMLLPVCSTDMAPPPSTATSSNNSTCTEVDETVIDSEGGQEDAHGIEAVGDLEEPADPAAVADPICDHDDDEEDWVEVYCSQPCHSSQTSLMARGEGNGFATSSSVLRKRKHEGQGVRDGHDEAEDEAVGEGGDGDQGGTGGGEVVAMEEAEPEGDNPVLIGINNEENDDASKTPVLPRSPHSAVRSSDSNDDSQFASLPSDDSLGPHTCSYFYDKINEAIPDIEEEVLRRKDED